ncbi:DUF6895 family protein [Wenjunlia tyrosinilytica]|uniref:DUF6895 domain-containing protein n=1 Tax=Wenjunlia tyrosinilytica TaxID=1544741 RepID=A0A917ZXN6_9ACTN|nr:hypothetical protein [Wenjunlia tyrosinilytica]GGO99869.1 hypothetical protein GCM10012280_67310 [Wenjunlia tyrosinilytica]
MTPKCTGSELPELWRAVEDRAVSWLAAHHGRFDPDAADETGVLFARKALVEVALLVGLRARLDPAPFDPHYQQLFDRMAAVASRASYRELVGRDERALLLYAGTHAALRLCGHADREFQHLLEQSVAGRYAACFERIPYRQLDLLHTLELAGVEHDMPGVEDVLPFTLLCADPSVLKLGDRDIYAITHTLFYATDFGLRLPRWPIGFDLSRATELLEALCLLCRRRGNADLVAELICSLLCLGIRDSAEAERAWAFLADVQEPDGRVAGPDGIVHPGLEGSGEDHRSWATAYHTTIVAALAALLARSRAVIRRPRPEPPAALDRAELESALCRATVWLVESAAVCPLDEAIPSVAAAVRGARAVGEPELAHPAVTSLVGRVGAASEQALWGSHGADVVFECAHGVTASGLSCPSLDRFLTDTADALAGVTVVPAAAAAGVGHLMRLGRLAPHTADSLLASADPAELRARSRPSAVVARDLAQYAGDEPSRIDSDDPGWYPVAERLAAALPDACRNYRLEEVAVLLGGLALLGWADHRVTRDGLEFLLRQQSPAGSFGFTARDDPQERASAQRRWTQSCVVALSHLVTVTG